MTRKEIEENMAPWPSELFIHVHGVTIRNDGHLISSRQHKNCLMTIVLNGMVMVQEKSLFSGDEKYKLQPTINELVHIDNIEAIEVYRGHSGQPLQYTGVRKPCGAVLIWTRL